MKKKPQEKVKKVPYTKNIIGGVYKKRLTEYKKTKGMILNAKDTYKSYELYTFATKILIV